MTVAKVSLWGRTIGAVRWDEKKKLGIFEYDPKFLNSGIEISPIKMPLSKKIYSFPDLARHSFHGLPGLLADSLPDKFGTALIDAWLAREGRVPGSFNPVERLCYIGSRGMGALEYSPVLGPKQKTSKVIDIASLVELASTILSSRNLMNLSFEESKLSSSLSEILQVGTSAGGARAKAIIAWDEKTNEVRSGQVNAGPGFSYWLLKFDGVSGNKDKELEDPTGFGLIEYSYYVMAKQAGIRMSDCRLLKEGGRSHFMTRRFDRTDSGGKLHMQSLAGLEHFDFNLAGAYSYEQVFQTISKLNLKMDDIEEQFKRMVFNILSRNQDDHVKNIAFLMDRRGIWNLSPAYDITYSYNPDGIWTSQHQMTLNEKRKDFEFVDFKTCANLVSMKRNRVKSILDEVRESVKNWPSIANEVGVDPRFIEEIQRNHRLEII